MTGQFREGRHSLGQRTTLAHDQLIFANVDGLLLAYLIEVTGSEFCDGHRAIVGLIEGGLYQGSFNT